MPPAVGGLHQGGLDKEQQARARALCLKGLRAFRDGGFTAVTEPEPARLRELLDYIAHGAPDVYLPLLAHELDVPHDCGAPGWTLTEVAPGRPFRVAVIGTGLSGLVAAYRLKQAGIETVVFEKNPGVGGTWFENTYPGCRLDTHNYAYSYSFAQKPDWPCYFSTQDSIRQYFADFATDSGLLPLIRFSTRVLSAAYDTDAATWRVTSRGASGPAVTETFDAIISAVGQLNTPLIPAFPGQELFAGPSFHTAQWRHDVDLADKRVGVIGTGASAFQVVPAIAGTVAELTVFQRNPPWILPSANYVDRIEEDQLWLFRTVPHYAQWFRFYQFWTSVEGRRRFSQAEPGWDKPGSVSAANEHLREKLTEFLTETFGDRPDLLEKVIPAYPPGAKRMLRDNGAWSRALKQDNAHLETGKILEFTPNGIRTDDGVEHELDVIIYSTGFSAQQFLSSFSVTGVNGLDLQEYWHGDARAYLGITIPHFPNLFCVYGPNTNLVVNGSTVLFSELSVEYILTAIKGLLTRGDAALDLREDAYERYNEALDAENRRMAWGAAGVNSWYKNAAGRVSQVWPYPLLDYWTASREVDLSVYSRVPLPPSARERVSAK
ncbi:NAD(P)/FAD-dependent oxidoreductase [Actinoallomurus sp. NBC_01490]|uniref:flavin-containing monooxygenase n=1 Tax=Actinoallomurus sp. NBC_01490 TaxID=2903557 RepID=UPI002E2F1D2A|nr:NAD(P)/FAD-dependent oxidoreductase [Actinoallomurus sp. NBC_01490]